MKTREYIKYSIIITPIIGGVLIFLVVTSGVGVPEEIKGLSSGEVHKKLQDPNFEISCSTLVWLLNNWNFFDEIQIRYDEQCTERELNP